MDINSCLNISYSGSLDAYRPAEKRGFLSWLKQWFWTYKNNTVDASTRTAYFLILAVKKLKEKGIHPENLQINLWGLIDPLNKKHVQLNGVEDYFNIEGYLPKQDSLTRLKKADLLFLPLEKSTLKDRKTLFIPGKLFEYLELRIPILALCEDSDCKDILLESGMGICLEPDNPDLIAESISHILQNPALLKGMKGNDAFIDGFSFKNKTKALAEVLNGLNVNSI